ncbi:hypothetical protein MTX26_15955 [Bradyrhizobium sp. ISRA443]|uniref:hypothetical protein n=1 Tax=unclassified Bradyrhizobium TaxID=2631580 RepID=UPI00247869A5|nr:MULTISPECIES: hypothetical protein [unclassified Bradyrhizobium]WGR91855.1 hypothetical protein MTX20_26525 [Bradyrhizobium sp. ISRA435]WGS02222.1 hypothetical protein MTX23_15965 [Bradyrhizobium sp. ISRA436]WGS09107.1 hypothetical protein MTX18_15955 [Bradyrhizobium sp. ISRA437]WGS15996.1 hypothetical protein MTX26_15955 [Bradyrhizobium sp. ISRA443]
MKFSCRFENRTTGELKDLVCTLDAREIADVERARETDGNEAAASAAAAIVLHSAYRDLDALEWKHLHSPVPVN